jgi:hypothetical protein
VYEAGLEEEAAAEPLEEVAAAVPLPAAVAVPFILGAGAITDPVPVAMGATGVTLTELVTGAEAALEMTEATEDETTAADEEPAAAAATLGQI